MTKVIIIGGGIGGLTLAHGLRGAGVDVEVHERDRHPTDRLHGFRIHINPHGADALRECLPAGLFTEFTARSGMGSNEFTFVTERLKRLLRIETGGHYGINRIALRQILLSGLDDVVRFDKKFERYTVADDGRVTAHFADGTSAVGDVLVGADGGGSRVRGQYLPHAERIDTGIIAIAGKYMLTEESRELIPPAFVSGPLSVLPPKSCGMFTAPHELDGDVQPYVFWAFSAKREYFGTDVESLGDMELRDLVLGLTEEWAPPLRGLVALSDVDTISALPIRSATPVPKWEASTITLLGDAIHSMTPFRGIGANTALRDAQLLCRKLTEGGRPLVERIAEYEAAMIEYGFAAVRASLTTARQSVSDSRTARLAGRAAFRVFDAVPSLKRRAFADLGR
ncbi:FAD-dependent oxidoreductase [Allokutzneria albata]|uniref:2-polyprenyl-6-methoxyphenol hydroxylase n=1 Tax=Allokutzneria albata TaxID=211114 RepID=A0A1G9RH03_ALLAB|nr:NAD(P)/FAD-dependent oxidoreductase [Allokutzneria albata]SDM22609.1 2-polyprenyl-6-methoxyphenol hydroxylase [Allokutzneria albata]